MIAWSRAHVPIVFVDLLLSAETPVVRQHVQFLLHSRELGTANAQISTQRITHGTVGCTAGTKAVKLDGWAATVTTNHGATGADVVRYVTITDSFADDVYPVLLCAICTTNGSAIAISCNNWWRNVRYGRRARRVHEFILTREHNY